MDIFNDNKITQLHINGTNLLDAGQLQLALNAFYEAYRTYSGTSSIALWRLNHNMTLAYTRAGQPGDALPYAQKLVELDSNDSESWNALGVVHLQLEQYDLAINALSQALRIHPGNASMEDDLGCAYLWQGDFKNARLHFQKAVDLKPEEIDYRVDLGNALRDLGGDNVCGAEKALNDALAMQEEQDRLENDYRPSETRVALFKQMARVQTALGNRKLSYEFYQKAVVAAIEVQKGFRLCRNQLDDLVTEVLKSRPSEPIKISEEIKPKQG